MKNKRKTAALLILGSSVLFSSCTIIHDVTGKPSETAPVTTQEPFSTEEVYEPSSEEETYRRLFPQLAEHPDETTTEKKTETTERKDDKTTTEKETTTSVAEEPTTEKPAREPEDDDVLTRIAKEVIAGKWDNGQERKRMLNEAGYTPAEVQRRVNDILGYDVEIPDDSDGKERKG